MLITPVKLVPGMFEGPEFDQAFASAMRKASICTPVPKTELAPAVVAPASSGHGGAFKQAKRSNLDQTGMRLVKKGRIVSYGGLRGLVQKVSRGTCIVKPMDIAGRCKYATDCWYCESVAVVA